jgi:glycosyltransferase involved in cell wall biosynthesis
LKSVLENPSTIENVNFFKRLRQTRKRLKEVHLAASDESSWTGFSPMVSVMLITYNHGKYVKEALDSVLEQKCDFDFEINVIDDCSTDNTQEIVLEYQDRYPDIINCYFNERNIGHIATQLNTIRGFQTLRGKYFCLLEGDDYWTSPDKLQRQVDFLEKNHEFVACAHNTFKVFGDGRPPEHFLPFKLFGRDRAAMLDLVNMAGVFHLSSLVYRNKFGLNPPLCLADPYSCEVIINMVYGQYGDFYCFDEYMSNYRVHEGGLFSQRGLDDGWCFHLYGYQRFFLYLGPKYWVLFANAVIIFSTYVLSAYKKGLSEKLKLSTRFVFRLNLIAAWMLSGPARFHKMMKGAGGKLYSKILTEPFDRIRVSIKRFF